MFSTEVGKRVRRSRKPIFKSAREQTGYLIYGPYETLGAGSYLAKFEIQLSDEIEPVSLSDWPVVCGRADVAINGGHIIASTSLYANRLISDKPIFLPFALPDTQAVEYRIYTSGRFSLTANEPQLIRRSALDNGYEPVFGQDVVPTLQFVKENFGHFRFLFENGMDFVEDAQSAIGHFDGIAFRLENIEDCQVVNEVLFTNEYNFEIGDCVFIDVGMNVGLTSLQAASRPWVKAVYSFEPFNVPRTRAASNFVLNPSFSAKIKVHPFGLSNSKQILEVSVSNSETIGTSIRGTAGPGDRKEKIEVRDAAEALREIIELAVNGNQKVVAKIDCEGSEFALFESLDRAGLLASIDILMIEWHKWWSSAATQNTLITTLRKFGFSVFDRTTPANIFAGMIYAVRTA